MSLLRLFVNGSAGQIAVYLYTLLQIKITCNLNMDFLLEFKQFRESFKNFQAITHVLNYMCTLWLEHGFGLFWKWLQTAVCRGI